MKYNSTNAKEKFLLFEANCSIPTFEENGIIMLGVVFYSVIFLPIELIVFNKSFFIPHWRYRVLNSNLKRYFTSIIFCKVLGVWKLPNWPRSGLNYAHFEKFVHNAESVTRIFMRDELTRTTKLFQIELRLADLIGRITFIRLIITHFDIVQNV